MSDADWHDDDHEEKVDLRLWRKLLDYTLHFRRTTITSPHQRIQAIQLTAALMDPTTKVVFSVNRWSPP